MVPLERQESRAYALLPKISRGCAPWTLDPLGGSALRAELLVVGALRLLIISKHRHLVPAELAPALALRSCSEHIYEVYELDPPFLGPLPRILGRSIRAATTSSLRAFLRARI